MEERIPNWAAYVAFIGAVMACVGLGLWIFGDRLGMIVAPIGLGLAAIGFRAAEKALNAQQSENA